MRQRGRIILAFLLLAAGSTALFGWMASSAIHHGFANYIRDDQDTLLSQWTEVLGNYYQQQGSWDQVEELLSVRGMGRGMGFGMGWGIGNGPSPGGPMSGAGVSGSLILADSEGRPIVPASENTGMKLPSPRAMLDNGRPIEVNGTTVGYLLFSPGGGVRQALEEKFTDSITRSMIWSGSAAVLVALLLGIYLSRRLTRPLERLTQATALVAAGQTAAKVDVASHDEIGRLGTAFNRMIEALEHNEKVRRSLVEDVAHELRTPLSILRGNLESTLTGVVEPTEEFHAQLLDEVMRMSILIRDLQEIHLVEAGKFPLHKEKVSIREWIYKWVSPFRLEAEARNIEVMISIEENLPVIYVDPQRFAQVMGNLLSNALRYTPENGCIQVEAKVRDDRLTLSVSDNGPGISGQDLPYIFERFYRGDAGRSRAEGGTGLGLAITKGLVELHGGSILVTSAPGAGTTFQIRLPLE